MILQYVTNLIQITESNWTLAALSGAGKLAGHMIKDPLKTGVVGGTALATKSLADIGADHKSHSTGTSPVQHQVHSKSHAGAHTWKTDSKGHVSGTKLTPQGYNDHLVKKFGVDRANSAISRASGHQH